MIELRWNKNTISRDYQPVIKNLYKMRDRCEKITKIILRFCEKNNIVLHSSEPVQQPFNSNVFQILYNKIIAHSSYQYIKPTVDMNLKLLKFQIQEDMPVEMQCQYYVNMTSLLQENIQELMTWADNNISQIKKINAEV